MWIWIKIILKKMNFLVIIGSSNLLKSKLEEFIKFPCKTLNLSLLNVPHGNQ
jgi:hypothetical protein